MRHNAGVSKRSAGILLYRPDGPQVLVVHPGGPFFKNKDAGAWTLPKGEYEPDEDPKAAALREFTEETGMALPDHDLVALGEVKLRSGKVIKAWAAEGDFDVESLRSNTFDLEWPPRSGRRQTFPEVDRALWCDPTTARQKLNPAQIPFVDRLVELLR
ncbi:NUDIX domain-containing protein [Saccharopolyspora mangrovi]|uniref:NUDIX domain-containing protein n=1 Tax=Saccharopolyspora mangrovi TaxID=3082379 RepID=A0ABU6A6T2_9PSEU|nr:NUDIX domain-containing protein [Saccharopolyspora sp. S2-29]MEB3367189.1 NUDIX domain-containing protein [Saccharopolyspora sp. S2-29]